jgi:hypothetical protein
MSLRYAPVAKARPRFAAVQYQDRRDPTRLIAERGRPAVRRALANAVRLFRATLPVKAMAAKIAARDLIGAADLVNVATLRHDLKGAFAALAAVHKGAGDHAAEQINAALGKARQRARVRKDTSTFSGVPQPPSRFAFDLYAGEVMQALADYQDTFITAMTDDVRKTVFDAIAAGVREGADPEDVAAGIRDAIGLNDRQALAVENYRAALEGNEARSLGYQLRDDDADEAVQAALDSGVPLDPARIDELVNGYVERSLDYRADMIAQTESNRAANMGLQASYRQAVAAGVFPEAAVKQYWMLALDEKTCLTCILIAVGANLGIGIGDGFLSEGEEVDAPPVHPNCRCTLEMRTNLDIVDASEAFEAAA